MGGTAENEIWKEQKPTQGDRDGYWDPVYHHVRCARTVFLTDDGSGKHSPLAFIP